MDFSYYHSTSAKPLIYSTYWDVLDKHCDSTPDKEAVVFYHGDQCYFRATFKQIKETSLQNAALLIIKFPELNCGDRFAIVGSNSPEVMISELIAYRLGLTVVFPPVGPKEATTFYEELHLTKCVGLVIESTDLKQEMLHSLFQQVATIKFVIVFGENAEQIAEVMSNVITWKSLFDVSVFSEDRVTAVEESAKVTPEMEAVIYYSSGSTGTPKAAVWSHFGLVNNGILFGKMNGCNAKTRYLQDRPITSGGGAAFSTRLIAICGVTGVILKTGLTEEIPDPKTIYKIIQTEKVNKLLMVGYMMFDFINESHTWECELETANTAGQVLNMEHVGSVKEKVPKLHVADVYGSTEMQVVLVNNITTSQGFTGKPLQHMEVKVINEHGETVKVGEPGELCFRSPMFMVGYITTEGVVTGKDIQGWYHTDDRVLMNEKKEIKVLGRMSDVIRRGGFMVFHGLIEAALAKHDKVQDVQVVGVSDPRLYQEVCACIVRSDQSMTVSQIRDWYSTHFQSLNNTEPKYYIFLDAFPRTYSGKVDRKKLRSIAEKKINNERTL